MGGRDNGPAYPPDLCIKKIQFYVSFRTNPQWISDTIWGHFYLPRKHFYFSFLFRLIRIALRASPRPSLTSRKHFWYPFLNLFSMRLGRPHHPQIDVISIPSSLEHRTSCQHQWCEKTYGFHRRAPWFGWMPGVSSLTCLSTLVFQN